MSKNIGRYIPPLTIAGTPLSGSLPEIFPGVIGYAIKHHDRINIPMIDAVKRGNGDVGKFLDALHPSCVVVNVTNNKLAGMLNRRGWRLTYEKANEYGGELCDVWIRQKLSKE